MRSAPTGEYKRNKLLAITGSLDTCVGGILKSGTYVIMPKPISSIAS